ncbi:class I SAM-dependent methyltransferase [Solibacillus cecembensis]|uniref:class I SAM-dependent methyltransferase n=1 Tax=Solibacillus cecembensis TaxID=459347 RepID=UPI003D04EBF1
MRNIDELNVSAWTKEIKKNVMLYPNERVVAFLGRNYKPIDNNSKRKALDIGFGSGRHLKLLLDYNFNTYGTDYSEQCVQVAKEVLGNNSLLHGLYNKSFEELEFNKETFDVILFWGVAFLRPLSKMKSDMESIYKLLKKGGKAIINFRTTEDDMYQNGQKVEENTFILDETFIDYENMVYTFLSLDDAKSLVTDSGFKIINIERDDYWKNNLQQKNSWWVFTLEK